ncbi:MAG: hypothetical protein ACFCVG_19315 [Kineosporiaceae bacterium]
MTLPEPVFLERGRTWTFASALDWPGWCRRAKGGDEAAVGALHDYEDRYRRVVAPAGLAPGPAALTVVGAAPGNATTDFGAPDVMAPGEDGPVTPDEAERLALVLGACWSALDAIAAGAPAELRRGPRGGGRDRDAVADHVREAERTYTRRIGVRVPPRTPWPQQRERIVAGIRAAAGDARWPVRYYVRRTAWHVLDHAWEIEDRTP